MGWTLRDDLTILAYTLFQVFVGFLLGCTLTLAVAKHTERAQEGNETCE